MTIARSGIPRSRYDAANKNTAKAKRQATDLADTVRSITNDKAVHEAIDAWERDTGLRGRVRSSGTAEPQETVSGLDRLRGMTQEQIAAELREDPSAVHAAMEGRDSSSATGGIPDTLDGIRALSQEDIVALGPEAVAEQAARLTKAER